MKTIFISYSHKDKRWLEELTDFLKPLERAKKVSLWIDHAKIKSGDSWKQEITQALAEAELALLLVTQRFIVSDFIHQNELPQLLERARTEGVKILWIALSRSTVRDTEINTYQALNDPGKPLDRLRPARRNDVWHEIYEKIKQALEEAPVQPEKVIGEIPEDIAPSEPETAPARVEQDIAAAPPLQPEMGKIEARAPTNKEMASGETGPAAEEVITNSVGMTVRLIPAGTFQMGSPKGEKGRFDNERQHQVFLSRPFYLQTTPVTQGQWRQVMGSTPASFQEGWEDCPVEKVSWDEAQEFVAKLNQMEEIDAYRLPTEAEWEYACRAGTTTRFGCGDEEAKLPDYAWFAENSGGKTHPVGQKEPNAWGLYDMHGNVWEWCQDWYEEYPPGPVTDPPGSDTGEYRVLRGGSWGNFSGYLRSAVRYLIDPDNRSNYVGFRVARTV
jgi:formylglycine-generating enzyme required for sulfatase activity